MTTIEPPALKEMIDTQADFVLIDVRERHEHETFNIGGLCIPMKDIIKKMEAIPKHKPVVLYCAKGLRSAIAAERLEYKDKKYTNLINLNGGIKNWRYYYYGGTILKPY